MPIKKNAPVLLHTLKQFLELHPGWRADLVGEGLNSERVKKVLVSSNLHSRVTAHGVVDHGTLSLRLRSAAPLSVRNRFR